MLYTLVFVALTSTGKVREKERKLFCMMPAKILHYRTRKTRHEVHTCRKQLPLTVKVSPMNHGNLRILTMVGLLTFRS